MDPNELLKNLLEAQAFLQKYMDADDPEAALLDAINADMAEGKMDVHQHLTTLIFGFKDLEDWLCMGGFAPARWTPSKQLSFDMQGTRADMEHNLAEDLRSILFPGGDREHEWDSDTLGEIGALAEKYKL